MGRVEPSSARCAGDAPDEPRSRPASTQRGGDRGEAVRGGQGELVGRLQPARGQQVGHRRPPWPAARPCVIASIRKVAIAAQATTSRAAGRDQRDERDRGEEHEPEQVADDHGVAPVEPVGEHAGDRAEQQRRQQPDRDHAAERGALRGRAGDLLRRRRSRWRAGRASHRARPRRARATAAGTAGSAGSTAARARPVGSAWAPRPLGVDMTGRRRRRPPRVARVAGCRLAVDRSALAGTNALPARPPLDPL